MSRRILFLVGSLRSDSMNRRLSGVVTRLLPDSVEATTFDLGSIPLYNADVDQTDTVPDSVKALRQHISEADGVYWTTPEYNYALPGVVKNVIDWASRPLIPMSSLVGKPMTGAVATASVTNGVRALSDLKRFWTSVGGVVVPLPDVVIQNAAQRFITDDSGADSLDPAALAMLGLSVRSLLRLIESDVSSAIQANWSDYLAVLRA
jgi:chromate reductase